MRIRVAGLSQKASRAQNDDHYCIGHWVEQSALISLNFDCQARFFREYGLLAAVADGMGGYAGGAYASQVALEVLQAQFYGETHAECTRDDLTASVRKYLSRTQALLSGALLRKPGFRDAGTTIAGVALMPPDMLVVFHAGDSRVMRSSGGFCRALTIDHTPLGADIAYGRISEGEASARAETSSLTRSLGANIDSEVEIAAEQSWSAEDRFMICTDGFHGVGRGLSRAEIRESLSVENDVGALVGRLVAQSVDRDGKDNSTLVIVDIDDEGDAHERQNASGRA